MKGHSKVITCLNKVLSNELTAIHQYFLHARICKSWGYSQLATQIYNESVDEMKHAQQLIDRILFLESIPQLQHNLSIEVGTNVLEQLQKDLKLELQSLPVLNEGIDICWNAKDHNTRELLEGILSSEENHIDWLKIQISCIKDIGIENYLAQQMHNT